jgi:hypothetical protein
MLDGWARSGAGDSARPSEKAYRRFKRVMRDLVQEPDAVAGVTLADGSRAALVLHGQSVYIASAEGDEGEAQVHVRREPLDPAQVVVSMDELEGDMPATWMRTWTFERNGEVFLSFLVRNREREDEEPPDAVMARLLCQAVGWEWPAD